MAALSKAESRHLYSWWWDSHISPKNSKWLQENLTDMDSKVKSMIKLIEEDADSFARRAEMYYKKRPELMKLVEEFYRAYRALAERYDHATGALRQAQKTMSEAFPNQIPFAVTDESPTGSTSAELEPCTPDNPPPMGSFFDSDDLPRDFSSSSSPFNTKRNGAYSNDNESATSKKGLKQLTEFFSDNRVRKGLNFQEEQTKGYGNNLKSLKKLGGDDEASQYAKRLQEEVSQLSDENQSLKMQVNSESKSRSNAESELQWLQKAHSKLKSEREEAVQQFQQSLRRIFVLEAEIEKFKTQSSEMLAKIATLDSMEEKCMLLEKEKHSLQLEIGTMEHNSNERQVELARKEEEMEKLKIAVQDEHMRCVHTEAALESLQTLHAKSVEALRISVLEIQNGVQLLKETETKKQYLEKKLQNAKVKIQNLNDENVSSQQLIKTYQDEISVLKEAQKKLENEVEHESDVKKCLEKELYYLKEEISDLLRSHKGITDQIEAVGLNGESLQSSVKGLQDANLELKELCKEKKDENVLLLEKLEKMQEISERNALLDNSLSDANVELDRLRSKIKALQESCELLNEENSALESEKTVLASKVETVTDSIEKLSEKNTFLENSLSDAIIELEGLRGRLKSIEESCQSLEEDKANLQNENKTLTSQVESMGNSLEDLGKRFAQLHDKHSYLEKEKTMKNSELTELQYLFNVKRQQYEAFMDASNAKLVNLEDEIRRLHQNSNCREEEFMEEQHKFFAAQLEIFIFQGSIHDLKEKNVILSKEWHKMEQYILGQQEKEVAMLDRIERLKRVIHMVWRAINTNEDCMLIDGSEELSLQFILDKIKGMQNTARDAEEERQSLLLEKSVYVTLLQQLGHHITDLRLEKNDLYQDCRKKTDELLVLENEKHDLIEVNSQLKYELEASHRREGRLEKEMKILDRQTLELKEAQSVSQDENQKLFEENELLSSKLSDMREEMHLLEEEYSTIFQRAAVLDSLSLVFEQLSSDKIKDLKMLNNDLNHSHNINNDLENKVMELAEKSEVVEAENMHLKDLALKLEECRDHLTILVVDMSLARTVNEELSSQIKQLDQLIENRNSLLIQKDMVLSEADQNFQDLQSQNTILHGNLEGIKLELDEVKVVRDGLEKKIATFLENMANKDNEIALALDANEMLGKELQRLDKENGDLRMWERESRSMLLNKVNCCEEEFAGLCNDIQVANVHAVLYEEKVLELMRVCESLETRNLVQREDTEEEVLSKRAQIEELIAKLEDLEGEKRVMKAELNEYVSVVSSLGNSISSLENLIIPPRKHHSSDHHEMQDDCAMRIGRGSLEQSEDLKSEVPQGVLELQKLLTRVETLCEAIVATGGHLAPSGCAGDGSKSVVTNVDDKGATSRKHHGPTTDTLTSTSKDELMMKDIQLDHVSSSSKYDGAYGIGNMDNAKNDDEMLRLWETTERDSNKKITGYHQREAMEGEKSKYPSSELVAEKELGVDKLEVPKKAKDFHHSWNKEVVERLSSDSERLTALQKGVEELKSKMEKSEEQNIPKSFELDTLKMQLQDAEATIMQLVATNWKLNKRAQDCSTSSGANDEEMDETKALKKRQLSERARRGSDKIGRLELELQKLQYILLKLEEEYDNHRSRAKDQRSRVLLRDYLYGRRERRRRRSLCGCMRSTTSDD